MKVNIILFGQLTDITGSDSLELDNVADSDMLTEKLHQRFPALAHAKYMIAINKKIIGGNTILPDNCTVALMPPFSGG